MRRRTASVWIGLLGAMALGPGIVPRLQAADAAAKKTVVVFAAASTTNAVDEIRRAFTAANDDIDVRCSFASSATLARQIASGADADVFLSADVAWADHLAKKELVVQRRDLLANSLVIIVPSDSRLTMREPDDLRAESIRNLALGNPESVPAGKYAKQALERLGLWDSVKSKVVAAEDVRAALAYVETGAAEAGMVYATDAAISSNVKTAVAIAPSLSEPIRYPLMLIEPARRNPAARSFYQYLVRPESLKVFQKYGFVILPEADTKHD